MPKIYLSPSTQESNPYVTGGGSGGSTTGTVRIPFPPAARHGFPYPAGCAMRCPGGAKRKTISMEPSLCTRITSTNSVSNPRVRL